MVSRKTILLTVSVIAAVAVAAAMTVQAQDDQQSSRRTHRPAEQSSTPTPVPVPKPADSGTTQPGTTQPGTTQPGTTQPGAAQPGAAQPGTSPPANPVREPATGDAYDPFSSRQAQPPEPRRFGGDASSQLPSQPAQSGGSQMPGSLNPDEAANALRPVPQQADQQPKPDPFASSRAPERIDENDPFGRFPSRSGASAGDPRPQENNSLRDTDPFAGAAPQPVPAQETTSPSVDSSAQDSGPFAHFATRTPPRVKRGEAVTGGATLLRQQAPSLLVETKGPEEVIVGREAVLRVQLFNEGDLVIRDIALLMELPADVEFVGAEPTGGRMETAAAVGNGMQWKISSVNPGGGESLTLRVIPKSSQPLDIKMHWTTAPAEAVAQLKVLEPKLSLNVSGPKEIGYGEKAVYTMTFANAGTADAEDVEVMLMPLEPGDQPETHEIGTIAAGSKRDVEIELIPKQTGTLKIRAEATAIGGLVAQVSEDVLIRRAAIDVQLEGPNFRYAKTPATYRLRVKNPGNAPTAGLQVGAILPPGAKVVSTSHNGQEEAGGRVRWRLDSLAAGAETVLELRCELIQAGVNRLEAVALADGELRAEHEYTTEVEALADLNLNVRDPKGPVPVGEETEYEIVISNRGTNAAERIEIVAYFSEGIEPVSVTGATHQLQPGVVILGPLPVLPADDETIIKVKAKAHTPGNHQFRVELNCAALDTQLAEQKMTRFYGDARSMPTTQGSSLNPTRRYEESTDPTQREVHEDSNNGDQGNQSGATPNRYSDWPTAGDSNSNGSAQPVPSGQPVPVGQGPAEQTAPADRYGERYPVDTGYRNNSGSATGQPTPAQAQPTPAGQPAPAEQHSSRRQQPTPADGE